MDISDILTHLGEERENYFQAVAPPIMQSSIFCFKDVAEMRHGLQNEFETYLYTRGLNPTVEMLCKKVAALEGAEDALVFGSGSAAVAAAIMSVVKNGDHVICVKKPYSWTNKLLNTNLAEYGVETTMVDGTDISNFEAALQSNTKLIYLETPNSWTFELQDLKAVADLAKNHDLITICDNSYATPLFQTPIALGIDMTVHSASKFLNGHSDVVAGVLCGNKERIAEIMERQYMTVGAVIAPNDAWLMMRGLRTLQLRVERSAASGEEVAGFLENHNKVESIMYPFSKSHPQYELATSQMRGCTGMFTIALKVKEMEQVEAFCNGLKRFLITCSWGGYESLIFPACTLYNSQNYDTPDLHWSWCRIYVGIEEPEVLIADLDQALKEVR